MSGAWDRARAQHGHPLHRDHTEDLETGIAAAVREIDEMRAIIDRIRDYAHWQRQMADELCAIGKVYEAIPYRDTATALERILGDRT